MNENNILVKANLKGENVFIVMHYETEKNCYKCSETDEHPKPFSLRLPYSINVNPNNWSSKLSNEEIKYVIDNYEIKKYERNEVIEIEHGKAIVCSIPSHMALFNIIKNNIAKNEHQLLNDSNYDNTPKFTYYLKRID